LSNVVAPLEAFGSAYFRTGASLLPPWVGANIFSGQFDGLFNSFRPSR